MIRALMLVLITGLAAVLFSSCTDYERRGVNPRPFNEPASWEYNPYGDRIRN